MFRFPLIAIFSIVVQGCVSQASIESTMDSMYNVPSSGKSQFDGVKHIRMTHVSCANDIRFELYQDTNKHKLGVVLIHAGTNRIVNIDDGNSLLIKIDGELHKLKTTDSMTRHDKTYYGHGVEAPFSNKSYVVPEKLVRDIASSNEFLAKLLLLDKSYIESKCSSVTLQEYREVHKGSSYINDVTQEGIESSNKYTAHVGFKKFVQMMDSTKW